MRKTEARKKKKREKLRLFLPVRLLGFVTADLQLGFYTIGVLYRVPF